MTENQEILKAICELHALTKYYLIKVEEVGKKTLLQPIKEFRDAYDHILKTLFCNDDAVIKENLCAAMSHEFRAYIDTLDYFCIIIKEQVFLVCQKYLGKEKELVEKYPKYGKMKAFLLESIEKITKVRNDRETNKGKNIKEYKKIADKMFDYYKEFTASCG